MSFDLVQLNGRKIYEREAGILMPIFSLPGKYGIGDIGKEAKSFIDILNNSNQQLWAMLPNGPVGYGNSPYQGISSCAGNHYFISPETLIKEKLLTSDEAIRDYGTNAQDIDYGKMFIQRKRMLECAYKRWLKQGGHREQAFLTFKYKNHDWLEDYVLFMSIKERFHYRPWYEWPEALKNHEATAINRIRSEDIEKIYFWEFTQYQFFKQWQELKEYANSKGVKLIGDMPFYVNHDSSDVWGNREIFDLNKDGSINLFSGIPGPNNTNIRWGNPCYNWEKMKESNYAWFAQRMQKGAEMYDIMRIDHAVAFVHYYGIKDINTPGQWYAGPDMEHRSVTDIIDAVARQRKMDIIVENLGNNTQRTHDLYDQLNWIGMRIFDYVIGDMHYGTRNIHLPSHYPQNVAAYTGTHDNESLSSIVSSKTEKELEYIKSYLNVKETKDIVWGAIDTLYKSAASKVILPLQDVLSLGNESRICYADDFNRSWRWRLESLNQIDEKIQKRLQGLSVIGARGQVAEEMIQTKGWENILNQAVYNRYKMAR